MVNPLELFGQKPTEGKDTSDSFSEALFYFMNQFKMFPLEEEYTVYDPKGKIIAKIVKKSITNKLFNKLLQERNEWIKKRNEDMKKATRKR